MPIGPAFSGDGCRSDAMLTTHSFLYGILDWAGIISLLTGDLLHVFGPSRRSEGIFSDRKLVFIWLLS